MTDVSRAEAREALAVILLSARADPYAKAYADAIDGAEAMALGLGETAEYGEHHQLLYVLSNLRGVTPELKAAKKTLEGRVATLRRKERKS